ncbi:MAG TPA: exodeoxyribonuclease V subunit alpha [Solirubrobacteraceae bacterium]|nr:exodeoxyribonuclease V subunit alpha [Solirubrobacteraceae bacterium]
MSAIDEPLELDPFAAELALRAPEPLAELNRAEVLLASDIHVASTLGQITSVSDPQILRCVALAVAAARQGHAFFGLEPDDAERMRDCGALVGADEAAPAPLRLVGTHLYLDRYWREEQRLAASLLARNRMRADIGDLAALGATITGLFPGDEAAEQRTAAAVAVLRDLTVIAGGPGTGKTTTVARIVGLTRTLAAEHEVPAPLIALCAPTGKAAARLQEAVGGSVRASTIHRLMGWLPGGRFRHDATNRLPHDLVIVDETSMVPLSLMVRLVDAVRDDAQLVLVGDPDQLAAIEVGAVLRDIVGPAAEAPQFGPGMRAALARVTGAEPAGTAEQHSFGDGVAVLRRGHRSVAPIAALAEAIRRGDADATVTALATGESNVTWLRDPVAEPEVLRERALAAYAPLIAAARAGDAAVALHQLTRFRLLCAHRHGPYGVAQWTDTVEAWLRAEVADFEPGAQPYPGLPLLVTRNDYELRLHNGDTGVVVSGSDGSGELRAVFDAGGAAIELAPSRLADVEPLFATTVHKSQGSEFDVAALLLPEADSPLLSRELLYTGVTRARNTLIVAGAEESVRAAVARPAGRATGLQELLWTPASGVRSRE